MTDLRGHFATGPKVLFGAKYTINIGRKLLLFKFVILFYAYSHLSPLVTGTHTHSILNILLICAASGGQRGLKCLLSASGGLL